MDRYFDDNEEIEQHFIKLENTLLDIKIEEDESIEPIHEEFITIKTENIPISDNNSGIKLKSHRFLVQSFIYYVCPLCRKSFSSKVKRKKHFKSHFYLPPHFKKKSYFGHCMFICRFCGKMCIRKKEVSSHCLIYKTKISIPKVFLPNSTCSGIEETFPKLKTIKNEIEIEYDNFAIKQEPQDAAPTLSLQCEVCLKDFKSQASLNRHLNSLKLHQHSHLLLKMLKCEFCLKHFKSKVSLKYHQSFNCKDKLFKCLHCQKRYISKIKLQNHLCNQTSFNCNICGKHVGCKSYLNAHLASHSQERHFNCKKCTKTFKYPQDLKRHDLYHTGEKPFECYVCKKQFRLKQHLTRHIFCHNDQKPYQCEICSKTYVQKSSLTCHIRRHTNETPFKCNICFKEFTEKRILDYHHLSHTGIKSFECTICSKRFKQKQDLKRHLNTHIGKKSFTCEICGKQYTRNESLKEHSRTHTGEKPYKCNICSQMFSVRQYLAAHLLKHTKDVKLH